MPTEAPSRARPESPTDAQLAFAAGTPDSWHSGRLHAGNLWVYACSGRRLNRWAVDRDGNVVDFNSFVASQADLDIAFAQRERSAS